MRLNKQIWAKNKGFTLAEVLVTLAIIGVVAALTIPSLINSVNKSQYEAALKKNYSIISQAYKALEADGTDMTAAWPGTDDGAAALSILAPKLNILKNCGSAMGCWYDSPTYNLDGPIESSNYDSDMDGSSGKAVLADGSLITIDDSTSLCTDTPGTGPLTNSTCGKITIDINGNKKPNTIGRDIFYFWATKTGIYPRGANNDTPDGLGCPTSGYGCAYTVLTQGMNY